MLKYLVFVGIFVSFLGTLSYIKEVIKGRVKPNTVTWFIWSLAPLIAAAAAIVDGVGLAALPVFAEGFFPLMIFIIALFKKGALTKLTKFDIGCGVLSIMSLILWYITKKPVVAIAISILSDFFAALPTIIKSWKYPETEDSFAYFSGLVNASTSFAAIKVWNFSSMAFPIYIILLSGLITTFIERHRIFRRRKKPA